MESSTINGVFSYVPKVFQDGRGEFLEAFRGAEFQESLGHRFTLAQANVSVSSRGTIRGIHYADVPPGQAKYVTCVRGAILDVAVDIRVGSPTFGEYHAVRLDEKNHEALYLPEGVGHAFCALTDDATVVYLCSEPYRPDREHGIHPLDPAIGVAWPDDIDPVLSEKDSAAATLEQARGRGALPAYDECVHWYEVQRD